MTPTCPTCPFLLHDRLYSGWGWCSAPQNRVHTDHWPEGFTPSQSPSGTCNLHPERAKATVGAEVRFASNDEPDEAQCERIDQAMLQHKACDGYEQHRIEIARLSFHERAMRRELP
jgi:hypothetical protein